MIVTFFLILFKRSVKSHLKFIVFLGLQSNSIDKNLCTMRAQSSIEINLQSRILREEKNREVWRWPPFADFFYRGKSDGASRHQY
jgi:hypothetical protein